MDDLNYIKNIHAYCDRWCEKCAFTARCSIYAAENSGQQNQTDLPNNTADVVFWEQLRDNFQQTLDMLKDMLEKLEDGEKDMEGLEDLEKNAAIPPLPNNQPPHDPAHAGAFHYTNAVSDFFQNNTDFFSHQEQLFEQQIRMGLAINIEELGFLSEALHTIRQFEDFIGFKISRAMAGKDADQVASLAPQHQSDSNGSAKAAVIAMQRSSDAWRFIAGFFPEKASEIDKIQGLLGTTRAHLIEAFPNWEQFHRPGFDDKPDAIVRLDYNPN